METPMQLVLSDMEKKVTLLLSVFLILVIGFGLTKYATNRAVKDGLAAVSLNNKSTLFTPLSSASLEKVDSKTFCVSTLANPLQDSEAFCTNFNNVHVYVDSTHAQGGTYA